jgi:hypothetical protein
MELMRMQQAVARLVTEDAGREQFLADPAASAAALGLIGGEARRLAEAADSLRLFARCLRKKRLREVRKLLPLTSRAIGPAFGTLFFRHAHGYLPRGTNRHPEDAIAFASFLGRTARRSPITPPWAADLARYEAGWAACALPTSRILIKWFRYPVRWLAQSLASGEEITSVPHGPALALWLRLPRREHVRHIVWKG